MQVFAIIPNPLDSAITFSKRILEHGNMLGVECIEMEGEKGACVYARSTTRGEVLALAILLGVSDRIFWQR